MTTRTCTLDHSDQASRYCPQCGQKLEQPLQDLRAHLVSQVQKSQLSLDNERQSDATEVGHPKRLELRQANVDKWQSWIEALDEKMQPSTAFTEP